MLDVQNAKYEEPVWDYGESQSTPHQIQHSRLVMFRAVVDEAISMYTDGINSYYITCLKIGAAADALGNPNQMED